MDYTCEGRAGKILSSEDLGKLHYFLGVNMKQHSEAGNIWIGQPSYVYSSSPQETWIRTLQTCCHTNGSRNKATESY